MTRRVLIAVLLSSLAQGAALTPPQTSFTGGQVSPLLWNRYDLDNYGHSCRTLQNMIVMPPGVATRRPGTKYVAGTASNNIARFIPFVYDEATAYILELTDEVMQFYTAEDQVTSDDSAYSIETPFEESELFEIQYYQSGDTMWLTHPNHPPQELTYTSESSWTIADFNFADAPFLTENDDADVTITPSATTGSITLTASESLFAATDVNTTWAIRHLVATDNIVHLLPFYDDVNEAHVYNDTDYPFTASDAVIVGDDQEWFWRVAGTGEPWDAWQGRVKLQASYDDGATWVTLAEGQNSSTGVALNLSKRGTNTTGDDMRLRTVISEWVAGFIFIGYDLDSYTHEGVVRITEYTSTTVVTADVIYRLGSTDATDRWAKSLLGGTFGWPACVSFNNDRLLFARTADKPLTIWASGSGEDYWHRFASGTDLGDPWAFTITLPTQNPINWVLGSESDSILLGTLGGIVELRPLDGAGGFTASNPPKVHRTIAVRADWTQPVQADNAVLFLSRDGRQVHSLYYDDRADGRIAPELTMVNQQIAGTGLTQLAYQNEPQQVLWSVRNDGYLAALTYYQNYGIAAWHQHVTDGDVVSVATIPYTNGDQLWLCVKRTVAGTDTYTVEYLEDIDLDASCRDAYYLDCGVTWDYGASANVRAVSREADATVYLSTWPSNFTDGDLIRFEEIGGMTQLNHRVFTIYNSDSTAKTMQLKDASASTMIDTSGFSAYTSGGTVEEVAQTLTGCTQWASDTVTLLADGEKFEDVAVSADGAITLTGYANTIHAGAAYTSIIEPMPVEFAWQGGISTGKIKRFTGMTVSLYNSCVAEYGASASSMAYMPWLRTPTDLTFEPTLKTGSLLLEPFGGWQPRDLTFLIQTSDPWPLTVRGLVPEVTIP